MTNPYRSTENYNASICSEKKRTRTLGANSHLESDPVGEPATDAAHEGQRPSGARKQQVDAELQQSERQTEPDTADSDEAKLLFAADEEHLVQQLFVFQQLGGHHVFDVKHIIDIILNVLHHLRHE